MFRFRRILCPLDFFPGSMSAFQFALGLATKWKAAIHVLHAIPPVITSAYGATVGAAEFEADLQRDSRLRLRKLEAEAQAANVSITTEARVGSVDLQLRRAIKVKRPDLVIMGTHGRRGFERLVLGSVTERMLRHCPVPLLVIGPRGRRSVVSFGFRRILITTDFSEGTAVALANAIAIARENNAKVTLIHVVDDAIAAVSGEYREALLTGVEEKLKALVPKAGTNRRDIEFQVATGSPFRVIPRILKRGKYDLLVMNIHGKTLVERALIGSTAERVVRAVSGSCPILLIPLPTTKRRRTLHRN